MSDNHTKRGIPEIAGGTERRFWPVIIGGCHRSGTSLFRRLLNGHPNIFCPAEIKFFMDLLCQYPEDPFGHVRLGRTIASLGLSREIWLKEIGSAFVRCYYLATERAGKRRWADKNPDNAINVQYWDELLDGQFFFLLVMRHPFDVVASMREARMDKVIPLDVEGKADHVIRYMDTAYRYHRANPERSFVVRYEELVSRPESYLCEILPKIGEQYYPEMVNGILAEFHGDGLEDPKVKRHTCITSGNVDRWKGEFTSEEMVSLRKQLGSLCDEFGYSSE